MHVRFIVASYFGAGCRRTALVIGADENYLTTSGDEVEKGRNFTANEIYYGFSSAILGAELVKDLFKNKEVK
jgi:hypothetical protein